MNKIFIILFLLVSTLSADPTITFVGDIVLGQDYRFHGKTFDWQWSQLNGYSKEKARYYFSDDVRRILKNDYLTIANFEGTTFYDDIKPNLDKRFVFYGKPEYIDILTENGIDVVNLANNHAPYDYGNDGFKKTKETLSKKGLEVYAYNDIYGYNRREHGYSDAAGFCVCGLEAFHSFSVIKANIDKNIKKLRDVCKYVIYTFHWGTERQYQHNAFQEKVAHYAIDNGADLVVGHHPHVVQDIEDYKGKKIVYSLGNFIFGGNRNPSDKEAIMFQVKFFNKDFAEYKVIPIKISSLDYRNDYRIVLRDEFNEP